MVFLQKILLRHKEMSEKARVMMEKLKQNSTEGKEPKDEDYVSVIGEMLCTPESLLMIIYCIAERTSAEVTRTSQASHCGANQVGQVHESGFADFPHQACVHVA